MMNTKIIGKNKVLTNLEVFKNIILPSTLAITAVYISLENYLLFHTLIEVACVISAFIISIVAINTYKISHNSYFIFLGIAFIFVGSFNLLHSLAYKGIGIFQGDSSNLAAQLWIVTRFIESVSLLVSFNLLEKNLKEKTILLIYLIVSIILLMSIFLWRVFPACYIDGSGLTLFKKISEYIIESILILSIIALIKKSRMFYESVYTYMIFSLVIMTTSEIIFILYLNEFGILNVVAHILYAVSFYLMYKAISGTNIQHPYNLLFYQLVQTNNQLKIKTQELENSNEKLKAEIRERKITENKLIISEKRYKNLVETLPDAIFVHVDGKITLINDEAKKLLGAQDSNDIVGKMIWDFIHKDYHELIYKRLDKLKEESSMVPIAEEKFIKFNGQTVDVEITSTCSVNREKNIVISVVRDITERRLLNETIEYDKLKNEFFANMSHEFRTPLNVIHTTLQFMELYVVKNVPDNIRGTLERNTKIIKQNCYRLIRLVSNLIDITKMESGFLKLRLNNHNIINVVEEITLSVAQYIETKRVKLIFDTDVEEKTMACDAEKIERIMLNLLSNAVKFTNPGDKISVSIEDRGESIIIYVKDTGIGIPEHKLQFIFDTLRQVDKSLTRNNEGSGMGLSIVKSLVTMHGGKISVSSEYGKGSEFKMEFPVKILTDKDDTLEVATDRNSIDQLSIEFSDIYFDN